MAEDKVEKLFEEFPGITVEEWEALINKDLKGADYNKKLIWKTIEGFEVKPYYRAENLKDIKYLDSQANEFPFTRGNKLNNNNWQIQQDVAVNKIDEANRKALFSLSNGCNSVGFITNTNNFNDNNYNFDDQKQFCNLVKGIKLEETQINFISGFDTPVLLSMLEEEIKNQKLDKNKINSAFDYDPLGFLTLNGKFYNEPDEKNAFNILHNLIKFVKSQLPSAKIIGIHGNYFNNCGSDAVRELAFSLSIANEYLANLTEKGLKIDDITKYIHFNFGVGSNYFIEIAKLRAARILWANIVKAYNPDSEKSEDMFIHSVTSGWNKTIYDPHVNILRLTTEAMSAIIGGTNSLTVKPFDSAYKTSDDFSERVAKNIQIILKEESLFNKVIDPAGGSYYIENLTNMMIEKAWELFKIVEEQGGYIAAFKEGFVQDEIKKTQSKRNNNIATRKEIILGTNQYPNLNEKVKDNIQNHKSGETKNNDLIAEPIKQYRGAEQFEKIRLTTENSSGTAPKVFLLTYGNLAMRKARAAFATNFFGCAGFEIIDNAGFKTLDEGINAAIKSKSEIVVICSSDDEYAEFVPEIINKLNANTILVLAGYPVSLVDNFKQLGLNNFIHIKSDVVETLEHFQKLILEKTNCKA